MKLTCRKCGEDKDTLRLVTWMCEKCHEAHIRLIMLKRALVG